MKNYGCQLKRYLSPEMYQNFLVQVKKFKKLNLPESNPMLVIVYDVFSVS